MNTTPTPWSVGSDGKRIWVEYEYPQGCAPICSMHHTNEDEPIPESSMAANAKLIAQAVNSHEAMIEALKMTLLCLDGLGDRAFRVYNGQIAREKAQEALALACAEVVIDE